MSNSDPSRFVDRGNDVLYRKIHPDFWDKTTNKIKPAAFQDADKPYLGLSFFVARFKTPDQVLTFFGNISEGKKVCGDPTQPTSHLDMFDHGYRIARMSARVLNEIETTYKISLTFDTKGENEIDEKGHASILDGRQYFILFVKHAVLMDEVETFAAV